MNIKYKAFSLIELAVSVVIISIIIASVTIGISLQKQAYIRTISTEFNIIQSAISSFKIQYNALPGDIANATTLWPSASPATANGDGNGRINTQGIVPAGNEDLYVFQQLYLAGILPNYFVGGILSPRYISGQNIYKSKIDKGNHSVFYNGYYSYLGHVIEYGSVNTLDVYYHTNAAIFDANMSYQLDLKIDDGFASTGKLMTSKGTNISGTKCVDASNNYLLSDSTIACRHIVVVD